METLFLKSDIESSADLLQIEAALIRFLSKLDPTVLVSTGFPLTGPVPDLINITEQNRHTGAAAYHVFLNGQAVAICSPSAAGRLSGWYSPPQYSKAITAKGKVIRPAKLRQAARFTPGLITDVCHEVAEILSDRNVETYLGPDKDGINWLYEPADWVFGSYWAEIVNGIPTVFPNIARPSFGDLNGKAPYDLLGIVPAPFTKKVTPTAYAWGRVGATGPLKKLF